MTLEDLTEGEKKRFFTENLRGYIYGSAYSMAELGRKVGVSNRDTFYKQVELINRMSDKTIYDICEVLGLSERQRTELLMLAGYAIPPSVEQIISEAASAPEKADYSHSWRETARHTEYLIGNQTLNVPLEKLQPVPHFVGREEEIRWVLDHLHPGHIVTLVGPAGIGKTQIAAKAVDYLAPGEDPPERFPDGIVYYSFYSSSGEDKHRAEKALEHILTCLGQKPGPALDETVLDVLASKRVLLWLDGAEHADNLNRVLDVRGKQCGMLITSQNSNDVKQFGREILRLPPEQADLLLFNLGGDRAHRLNAAARIYELVGDVTLALDLAGAHLRPLRDEEQLEDYLRWLEKQRLKVLHRGKHRRQSVYVLMERSVSLVSQRLGKGARLVLAIMGILASQPVNPMVLAVTLGVQEDDVKPILEGLVDYNVLVQAGNRYAVRHNLIYDYIKDYLHAPDEAVTQLATYYADLADEQSKRGAEGYKHLDPERAHIAAVVTGCVARKQWTEVQRITKAVDRYFYLQGYWTDREAVWQAGLTAAKALEEQVVEARCLKNLGNVYADKGENEKAITYYEQARRIFEQLGDRHGLAGNYQNVGIVYYQKGESNRAITYYEQARSIFEQLEDRHNVASTYNNLGNAYVDKCQYNRAITYYEQARSIFEQLENHLYLASTFCNVGIAHYLKGENDQAITYYEQARSIFEKLGDRHGLAGIWVNIALVYLSTGRAQDVQEAKPLFAKALLTFARIGAPYAERAYDGLIKACGSVEGAKVYLARMRDVVARESE